ncbi:MAG: glycerol-3-phosphate acyltransferase [Kofleriaceae bacterium]
MAAARARGEHVTAALVVALAGLAGSIPFGLLLARRRGVDIRAQGSGNIGATNVTRVLGPRLGALVLVLDAGKGAGPIVLARHLGQAPSVIAVVGAAAILGHCFSPWLRLRGGKGVATALGVFVVLDPLLAALGGGVFVLVLAVTRVPALGSLAGTATVAAGLAARAPTPLALLGAGTLALLVYTHRGNLARLRAKVSGR